MDLNDNFLGRPAALLHAQTLVEMNRCVATARRDAAYAQLVQFVSTPKHLRTEGTASHLKTYQHCAVLLKDALTSTERSTVDIEQIPAWEQPAIHILKLQMALVDTMISLATHVALVENESDAINAALNADIVGILEKTCQDFTASERVARHSFKDMLSVGKALIENSTLNHRKHFTEEDERRYNIAFKEYSDYYRALQDNDEKAQKKPV